MAILAALKPTEGNCLDGYMAGVGWTGLGIRMELLAVGVEVEMGPEGGRHSWLGRGCVGNGA